MSTTPLRAASLNSALDESDDASVKFEVQTLRRVDRRLLPILGLMYAVAVIDGGNLGLARTAGMGEDLGLDIGSRYSIVSTFFFIPYILLQLPSNLILRYVGARTCIAFYVISWGAVQLGMGFVPSWGWLVVCRTLLGVFEAGFFSAVTFIITTWYRRHEVQTRLAFFYLLTQAIAGFSAILAYAISLLKGKCGLNGWRWIFIIEGAGTIAFGIVSCAFLPDFPDRNTFLTKEETKLILDRIEQDRGDALPDKVTTAKVLRHMGDPMLWAYALMFMAATMPAYAISFFSTIIISGMGWDVGSSLLLTAPPYIFAVIVAFCFSWISDKSKQRGLFLAIQTIITIIGAAITGFAEPNGVRYFGLFLATAGCIGCIPSILAYSANNVVGHSKRSVTTAVVASSRGIGGIIASTVYVYFLPTTLVLCPMLTFARYAVFVSKIILDISMEFGR
ncbi:high-affinity nicotinic acid transporter [Moniliophthora roreri MCA 2997]|uniref:High-affinity nicotinic acid transporter n=1 Tax=Moniliophthora roreri (strain MCA 2997) TaxID=1381753 RepID=V2X237_MONRO|nr:high-affinity nicotinic acid transporter [Moniliophthora roreri MCA 2997]